MEAAIRQSLHRHGIAVETADRASAVKAVTVAAPDLALLIGDAVADRGVAVLRELAASPVASVVPVALLLDDASLDDRLRAFRSGAVAVVPRTASTHEIAKRVAELAKELPNRPGEAAGELGEATLDELVAVLTRELRSGILSVEGEDQGVRLVLGAGGPVAEALDAFVAKLKPLIERAEPLRYELLETSGGRLQLLDSDDKPKADVTLLRGLRLLLMDDDPARADGLAQALRAHGALVGVTEASARGLRRARGLDPAVIILDASTIEGAGFEAVRKIRRDPRLRWAGLLVAPWDEIWPKGAASPDVEELAGRIAPLVEHDRALRTRAADGAAFDTRLELTGPSRMLRVLANLEGTRHLSVRGAQATLELDVGDGLVIGATGKVGDREVEGTGALSVLLALSAGRVHVERRTHPATATVMTPVDQALDAAARSVKAGPSKPPAPLLSEPPASEPSEKKKKSGPFPTASELKAGKLAPSDDPDSQSGPLIRPSDRAAVREGSRETGAAISDEMRWEGGKLVSQVTGEPTDPEPTEAPVSRPLATVGDPRKADPLAKTMMGLTAPVAPVAATAPAASAAPPVRKKTMFGVGAVPPPAGIPTAARRSRSDKATPHVPMPAVIEGLAEPEGGDDDRPTARPPSGSVPPEEPTPGPYEEERVTQDLAVEDLESLPVPPPPPDGDPGAEPGRDDFDLAIVDAESPEPPVAATPRLPKEEPLVPRGDESTERLHLSKRRSGKRRWLVVALSLLGAGLAAAAVAFGPALLPDDRAVARHPSPPGSPTEGAAPGEAAPSETAPSEEAAPGEAAPSETAPSEEATPGETAPSETPPSETAPSDPAPSETALSDPAPSETPPSDPSPSEIEPTEAEPGADGELEAELAALNPRQRARRSNQLVDEARDALDAGDLTRAENLLARAERFDPGSHHVMAARSQLALAQGDPASAVEWAERALARRPRRAAYMVLLADALAAAGNRSRARRYYRRALEVEPNNGRARRGLRGG